MGTRLAHQLDASKEISTDISEPSLTELYDLVASLQRSSEANYSHLVNLLKIVEKRQSKLEEHMSMLISAIAINPVLRTNVVRDDDKGELTRTVMHKVPITLLMVLWKQYQPNHAFPASEDYVTKLCRSISDNYSVDIRRELGQVFSQVIKSGSIINLQAISTLLSDVASTYSSVMRAHIMKVYSNICGLYAFMFPATLCHFVAKIAEIDSKGIICYIDRPLNDNQLKSLNQPGKAFEVMGPDWLGRSAVLTYISNNKDRRGKKFMLALCTKLSNGSIPTDEETRHLGFKLDVAIDQILGTNRDQVIESTSIAQQDKHGQNRQLKANKPSNMAAKSLFKTVKKPI